MGTSIGGSADVSRRDSSFSLRIGAATDRGLVREENQDRISRIQSPFGDVFVVADGMGGHEGGATAAQMLIDGLGEHLRGLPAGTPPDAALREAAASANAEIHRQAQEDDPCLARMGATGVLALIDGSRAWVGHAGDSRAYLWRGGQLTRLTRDHTLVQRMLDHQILNEEEARNHPDAHVVTRAFGQKPEIELEVAPPLELYDGDHLLLCSDGLSGYVEDAAIAGVLATDGDAQAMTDALIGLALQAGGEDNVSVQLLAVQGEAAPAVAPPPVAFPSEAPPPATEKAPAQAARRRVPAFLLVLPLVLAAFVAGALLPWRDWLPRKPPALPPPEVAVPEVTTSDLDSTDPLAGTSGLGLVTGPGPEGDPLDTDLEPLPAVLPRPEITPPEPPPVDAATATTIETPRLEIVVLTQDDKISQALRGMAKVSVFPPDKLFSEGRVYYREGYEQEADRVLRILDTSGGRYDKVPWPEDVAFHPTAGVLVATNTARTGGTP